MTLWLYTHSLSIYELLNEWLAELPTTVDIFFTGIANTTNTSIGVEGGEWWGIMNR